MNITHSKGMTAAAFYAFKLKATIHHLQLHFFNVIETLLIYDYLVHTAHVSSLVSSYGGQGRDPHLGSTV